LHVEAVSNNSFLKPKFYFVDKIKVLMLPFDWCEVDNFV